MIAIADEFAYIRDAGIFVYFCDRYMLTWRAVTMSRLRERELTAVVVTLKCSHTRSKNLIYRERFVVNLHGTLDDSFGQPHVDVAIIDDRIGQ